MGEAFLAALRVGLEGALAGALGVVLLRASSLRRLAGPFAAAVAAGLAAGLTAALRAHGPVDELAAPLQRANALFALGLAGLALAARGRSADDLARTRLRPLAEAAALVAGLGVLLPEGAALAGVLRDLAVLRGSATPVWLAGAAGLSAAALLGAVAAALWGRAGLARGLGPSSFAALLLALELVGIGARAVGAHALPQLVTAAVSRSVHDAVHLLFVVGQLPDHAYLEDSVYQLILVFLEPALHAALAAVAVVAPLAAAWRAFARRPSADAAATRAGPERRAVRAAHLRETWLGSVAFALAVGLSTAAVWSARAVGDELYDPLPEPVVDDGAGQVIVPLGGPLAGPDGRMRKWVYAAPGGRSVTFFTVGRPDGSLAVALDLCEICQPKGYAQMGAAYVFCKYCKTPIPSATVGQPGGCNPVPVTGAELRGAVLVVPRDGLLATFTRATAERR